MRTKIWSHFNAATAKPIDFYLMFNVSFFEHLTRETNTFARMFIAERENGDKNWRETTADELKKYTGLLFLRTDIIYLFFAITV